LALRDTPGHDRRALGAARSPSSCAATGRGAAAVLMVIVSALATALSSPRRGFELLGGDAACYAEEDLLNGARDVVAQPFIVNRDPRGSIARCRRTTAG
jgi:hypothetical protein